MKPRANRLFASDGKCFDVAIDHGFFNEYHFLNGIEDIRRSIQMMVEAKPDAVQLTPGQAHYLQEIAGKEKPALVLRTDVANIYGSDLPKVLFSQLIEDPIEIAIRLDAACVVVNLFLLPDQPELYRQCVANICRLKPICDRFGMPLMVEPLVMQRNNEKGGYAVDGEITKIIPLVRQAVELGADIIKADPCEQIEQYYRVIETAGSIPVLVRGGGRVSDKEILMRTKELMEQGAAGIVYGRNVVQHPHPERMTRALMGIVHAGFEVDEALELLRLKS